MKTFISLICYEDLDVINTCKDLVKNSVHDIRIVVILQTSDPVKFADLYTIPKTEVYVFPESWAEGCGKARHEAFKHYQGENYFFQTDAHMRFVYGWDELLISQLRVCPVEKAILTTLPTNFDPDIQQMPECKVHFLGISSFWNHLPLSLGYEINPQHFASPIPGPLASGGATFGPGSVCSEYMPDPYLFFHGEEISMTLRLWTMGYDFYSPLIPFCWHSYRSPTKIRPNQRLEIRGVNYHERSIHRIHTLIGVTEKLLPDHLAELDKYGLGRVRSLKQYEDRFSINFKDQIFPTVSCLLSPYRLQRP